MPNHPPMSSRASSSALTFPERIRSRLRGLFDRWLRRRGPIQPPLTLRYRQIFILPTGFGWMIAILLHGMLLGSLNFNNSLGLFTTFLVAGVGLLSMHLAFRNLDRLGVDSIHGEPVFAGQRAEIRIALREHAGRARRGIVVLRPPDDPHGGVDLEPHGMAQASFGIEAPNRGHLQIGRVRIRTRQPLGLFEAWSWVESATKIRVWPRPADPAPPRPEPGNAERSRNAGEDSDEFHGLRDWREGDPLHRIAWKASQRHDRLLARQFMRPERGRVVFRIDQAGAGDLEARLSILCRWILDADRDDIEYGLELGGRSIAPGLGETHRIKCLDALADYT